jgi:Uma2 family endonuclease
MIASTEIMTADDLLRMSRGKVRYELIEGVLRVMEPAGAKHGIIAVRFTWRLAQHVEQQGLGEVFAAETGFLLARDPDTVRAPDIAFVRRERLEEVGEIEGYWPGAPDLAVEVISPGDTCAEVEAEAIMWLEAGTSMVLALNPRNRTVTVYRSFTAITILSEDDILDIGDIVDGFSVAVRELFA